MMYAKSFGLAATLLSAGAAFGAIFPEGSYPEQPSASRSEGRSRAEVIADLQLWQRAGVAADGGELSPDYYAPGYQLRLAEYQSLRDGPVYTELVRQIVSRTGERRAG